MSENNLGTLVIHNNWNGGTEGIVPNYAWNSYGFTPLSIGDEQMERRRIVQRYVVDKDPRLPVEYFIAYSEDEFITDASDWALQNSLDWNAILKEHNEKRTKVLDVKRSDELLGAEVFFKETDLDGLELRIRVLFTF